MAPGDDVVKKKSCRIKSIALQLHGLAGTGGGSTSAALSGRNTNHPTTAMAFYPGDTINGSVQFFLCQPSVFSNNGANKMTSDDDKSPTNQTSVDALFTSYNDNGSGDASNSSSPLSSSMTTTTDEVAAAANTVTNSDNNAIIVTLRGYGKTRIIGRFFRKQGVFIDQQRRIPIPRDLTSSSHNLFLFNFKLPDSLPPSFDGTNARIRYRISAKYQNVPEVRLPIDIRYNGQADEKVHTGADDDFDRRNMDMCCFSCGTRSVYAKIERSIFLHQGDVILIHARFHNLRSNQAQPFVRLVQRQSCRFEWRGFLSIHKSLHEWPLMPDADGSALAPFKDRNWNNARCSTPAVMPSFSSPIVKVDYFLEVGLRERGSIYSNPVVTLAVTMASNATAVPIDRAHLYMSGRKHPHRLMTGGITGPPTSFPRNSRGGDGNNGTGKGNNVMPTSDSQNSYLSAIAEAHEGESCEEDDDDFYDESGIHDD